MLPPTRTGAGPPTAVVAATPMRPASAPGGGGGSGLSAASCVIVGSTPGRKLNVTPKVIGPFAGASYVQRCSAAAADRERASAAEASAAGFRGVVVGTATTGLFVWRISARRPDSSRV